MRDYGTGLWDGGDPDCDHEGDERWYTESTAAVSSAGAFSEPGEANKERLKKGRWREAGTCKCGARRVDQQLGLEPTPDLYVERIVAVFRQVRRVLAPHGTCWVNLGDSYAGSPGGSGGWDGNNKNPDGSARTSRTAGDRWNNQAPGLKPKDLVGIPWRVAFALQADGWWLRADIIWAKPNPMPESVTDRPTKAHEYLFLLTKQPRYYFDQEAVREPWGDHGRDDMRSKGVRTGSAYVEQQGPQNNSAKGPDGRKKTTVQGADGSIQHRDGERWPNAGRNVRSVWQIATQPYPEAHFATYPEELVRRCVLAGCPERVCRVCGKPSERIVERQNESAYSRIKREHGITYKDMKAEAEANGITPGNVGGTHAPGQRGAQLDPTQNLTVGWSDCGHNDWRPGTVLDPFIGSGTTCKVARDHGRHSIGIDLSADYLNLAARRLQQLSLLTGWASEEAELVKAEVETWPRWMRPTD